MEELAFEQIEKIALNKSFQELNKDERAFILKHFENEEEYNMFRETIARAKTPSVVPFPDEIDDFVAQQLAPKKKSKFILLLPRLVNYAAIFVLICTAFLAGRVSKESTTTIVADVQTEYVMDAMMIEKDVLLRDTLFLEKIVYNTTTVTVIEAPTVESTPRMHTNDSIMNLAVSEPILLKKDKSSSSLSELSDLSLFLTPF